ncbi:MAG: hypothetical protein E6R04_04765 [Spirochaetes bacterium]|nr:MAG: hypothetical protein E6R04_04765 [Spirochaetota bacterium]
MLEVTKTDLVRCETVLKALRRGKYELEGEEVLAFAQAFGWLADHAEKIKAALAAPAPETQAKTKGAKK